jgi:hypothetical protein
MMAAPERLPVAACFFVMAVVFALLLALPGETITTAYMNDLFIFLDGAHRVVSGQVPNRDFHTALGPLVYYLPGLGLWLSGTFSGAMPTAMALVILALAPVMAHVLISRLRPAIALLFGAFLLLIVAVPTNLGENIAGLSFAMFYNRIGWAALAILLVMYLRPERPRPGQEPLDAACAAVLTLVMLYTKVTYGLVALAFLAFMLTDRRQYRWAAGAVAAVVASGIVVELFWRSSAAHVADLLLTGRVSGLRGMEDLVLGFARHLADYALFGIFAILALRRTRSVRNFLFFGFCAGPGLLIVIQNSQPWGIITLQAGSVVGAELLLRPARGPADEGTVSSATRGPIRFGAPWLLLAFLLPTSLHWLMALVLHAGLATAKFGENFGLPKFEGIRLARLWSPREDELSTAYLTSIRAGARALASLDLEPTRVSVLDFANPYSAGLGLTPPRGDNSWLHWGRNVSAEHFLPGEEMLGDVEVLMEPKWGINNIPLSNLYAEYIGRNFERVRETDSWTVHLRRGRHNRHEKRDERPDEHGPS